MGWFDIFSSFEDMIDDKLYYIKYKLKDWVEMIAFGAIMFYEEATGVGKTIWEDLELWLNDRIDDFLPDILLQITSARQLAQYLHDTLKLDLEEQIKGLSGLPEQVITLVMSKLEPKITSARQYAEYLTDTLEIELDKRINLVMASMASMETVAGEARVAFYNRLKSIIDEVEKEAKANLIEIYGILKENITLIEKSAKDARGVLENTLNSSLDLLEREAKEAREVLEGTVIQIIEGVEDALETAITDLERTFRGLLDIVIDRLDVLEGWVDSFAATFDTELNKYKERVVTWIVDGFEGILDRVFK